MTDQHLDRDLAELAGHYHVATSYENWRGERVEVPGEVVASVLTALGLDVSDPAATLRAARAAQPLLPPTVVTETGRAITVPVAGEVSRVVAHLEDGTERELPVGNEDVGGSEGVAVPDDLPEGWHRLVADAPGRPAAATSTLLVAPARLPDVPRLWGWQAQLYQLRSADSWGIGDLGDLRTLATWSGGTGAGLVLVNPMHAAPPVGRIDPSPYSPSSRRFRNPLYLRPELTPEYAAASAEVRAQVDALAAPLRAANRSERLDRDASWAAKEQALGLLWREALRPDRAAALDAFVAAGGEPLAGFLTFNALAEVHGPRFPDWPDELRDPAAPAVAKAAAELADRRRWHAWLQLLCDEQLAEAQDAAHAAGMPLGVVHDLAVGVTASGADAWQLQGVLAGGLQIGAPPDSYNQKGQDWGLPPWHPTALAEAGYAPYRDMIRSVLRHAGGVRIDHVLGLFRLWCIPTGESADRGSFVYYDHRAMLGVLMLEASRAGAVLIGEDLGTVAPYVADELASRGILGSDVLWFQMGPDPGTGEQRPMLPDDWRALAMSSVSTHDLPTAAGFLEGEHVRAREELHLLRDVDAEWTQARHERAAWLTALRDSGILPADEGTPVREEDIVLGLYTWLSRSPARLLGASLGDVVLDVRQPNLPGTVDEYPSWVIPIADQQHRPQLLEDLVAAPLAARVAAVLTASATVAPEPPDLQREQ